jgi:hypothetical protein
MAMATPAPNEPTLNLIPRENIESVRPLIEDHLKSVVERSKGKLTPDEIVDAFLSGKYQLWLIWNGSLLAVGATELTKVASGLKICTIHFLTGENSLSWLHLIGDLEQWAKAQGCGLMKGYMRKGWAKRLPDYHLTHVSLEKELA